MPTRRQITIQQDPVDARIERLRIPEKRQHELESIANEAWRGAEEWKTLEELCAPSELDDAIVRYLRSLGLNVNIKEAHAQLNPVLISIINRLNSQAKLAPFSQSAAHEKEHDASAAG